MTHEDFNDLETRDYIFKIGDREKAIQARYDENTDALIFSRAAFDYVYKLLKEALSQEPCDDAISREDAEQMFRNIRSHLKPQDYKSAEEFNTRDLMLLNAEQMVHALPSVTQKSGKWVLNIHDIPICSQCGYMTPYDRAIDNYEYGNFCPNCGCRMESEDKE